MSSTDGDPVDKKIEEVLEHFAEADDVHEGGCDYCGAPDVRDAPEPFGGKPCCDACFVLLVGGVDGEPPWKCGNA